MKLIREEIETVDFIVEERNGKKNMFIEGIFLQGDLKNRNGRMYPDGNSEKRSPEIHRKPRQFWVELLENSDIQMAQLLIWTASVTRLFHSKRMEQTSSVKLKSYLLLWVRLQSPSLVKALSWVFLRRGIGSLKQTREGVNVVGDDFMLSTAADIVADPSAPDAFVEGIMEGKDWVWDGGIFVNQELSQNLQTRSTLW